MSHRARILSLVVVALAVAACSHDKAQPFKRVSASGTTLGIAVDSDKHVAYLLNAPAQVGGRGELHVADADGNDTKIAMGISTGGYILSPRGTGMIYTQMLTSGVDAALFWVDLAKPSQMPKQLFAGGLQTQAVSATSNAAHYTTPLLQEGFLSPSGRYFVVGVLAPKVSVSPDLHVIDLDTGSDVFSRGNGAFDYLEVVLPDDTLIFQDADGNNGGPTAPPGVQTLSWVTLGGSGNATTFDTRTGQLIATGDNKTLVYQKVDTRELWTWDALAKPAAGTKLVSAALNFAVGQSGPVAYVGTDHSVHVVTLDGKEITSVDGATAKADLESPVYISADGHDVYYFQSVVTENAQGTLMHLAAMAGATPAKIADAASLSDVHPVTGGDRTGLMFLQNLDATGSFGDAMTSERDGSGAMMVGSHVAVGTLSIVTGTTPMPSWLAPHLSMATMNGTMPLPDGGRALSGALELTSPTNDVVVDPSVRLGQFTISADLQTMAYVGGATYDNGIVNYFGALESVSTATPTMKPLMPELTGVSELGVVSQAKQIFVNAPKASPAGVYLVKLP